MTLPPGHHGDLVIRTPTRLTGPPDAVFNSINILPGAEGSVLEGFSIALKPNALTSSASSALKIGAANVTVRGLTIRCGRSPADAQPGGSRVPGELIGRCITVEKAAGVLIEGCDLSDAHRGIVVDRAAGATIRDCHIHDLRTSPIVGSGVSDLTITDNRLRDSRPYGWGNAALDHGDFIHIWTDPKQTAPTRGILIARNVLSQGRGVALLGIYLDDNNLGIGFTDVVIRGNLIHNGNAAGIRAECLRGAVIEGNVMLPTPGTPTRRATTINLVATPADAVLAIRDNVLGPNKALAAWPDNTFLTAKTIAALVA